MWRKNATGRSDEYMLGVCCGRRDATGHRDEYTLEACGGKRYATKHRDEYTPKDTLLGVETITRSCHVEGDDTLLGIEMMHYWAQR